MVYCKICDSWSCEIQEHNFHIGKVLNKKKFSGSSPPEIFVGRYNYPNVYAGILSPEEHGDTKLLSSPEEWHNKQLSIQQILQQRQKLIYGRQQTNIKSFKDKFQEVKKPRFLEIMQEVAMTHKSIATSFLLKKPIFPNKEQDTKVPLIANAAEVQQVRLDENPSIKPKVEYLVNDNQAKSQEAILELEKANIETSSISKILSAGLLGLRKNRRLVPTRWSIVAVDSALSENKIKKIKDFSTISNYEVFHSEYLGNHYEILLMPRFWSFEIIEISLSNNGIWKDHETIIPRKAYADSVTGGYYSARLPVSEYLNDIKKQAAIVVLREIRPEYNVPLGVGILRETVRNAFKMQSNKFNTLKEALEDMQSRLKSPVNRFTKESQLLKGQQQKPISSYF